MVALNLPPDPGYAIDKATTEALNSASRAVKMEYRRLMESSGWLANDEWLDIDNEDSLIGSAYIIRGRINRRPAPGDLKLRDYYDRLRKELEK